MFFDTWLGLLRIVVVGTFAYVALVVLLRVSGKRTLSKLNAFDLVVTVALGSILATVLLNKSVPLLEGITAFLLMVGLQYVVAWFSVRSSSFSDLVKSEPTLLLYRGQFLENNMKIQRVTRAEILAALRSSGAADVGQVAAVALETDGSLSVIQNGSSAGSGGLDTLEGIKKPADGIN